MNTSIIKYIVIILLLLLCFSCFANTFADDSNYYTLFSEGFEGDFPPEGWSHKKTNEPYTWKKTDSAVDDYILPYLGDFFVYVGGATGYYNEILITPPISLNENHSCGPNGVIACEDSDNFNNNFDFVIEISYNYQNPGFHTWHRIGSIGGGEIKCWDGVGAKEPWEPFFFPNYNLSKGIFWIRFRYTGFIGNIIAFDSFEISCDSNQSPGDDDDNNDNNDDNNITDDMAGNSKNADGDDKDDKGCGFAGRTVDPAAPLALFMVLVGFIALFFNKRRGI